MASSASLPAKGSSRLLNPMLLLRLKEETREEQKRLERDLGLDRPDLRLVSYIPILERLYGFYLPWEVQIEEALKPRLGGFALARRKSYKLEADLRYVGLDPESVRFCAKLPEYKNVPEALGGMWVAEDAVLRGQIISRHLERTLDFAGGAGYSFFTSYGPDAGRMWQGFQQALLENTPPGSESAVIESARQTLRAMHQWLCRPK
ncbi:MAG: biliverdin-producing heme oxygenase [Acidobacteriaceae bacterium]|nr:biliverdin-producing heme oxygenase [Acidobacteriaceae bacterium]